MSVLIPLLLFSIRILDPNLQSLLVAGYSASPTLRTIVDSLDHRAQTAVTPGAEAMLSDLR